MRHLPRRRLSSAISSRAARSIYLEYFKSRDHVFVPSSSLIPKDDDGVYFVNSGVNQFKKIFMGTLPSNSQLCGLSRAVNSQRCGRVGGKHNDLMNVGGDLTHHTFFEMLGSWSFGSYFKKEACQMAWELLTGDQYYNLDKNRLYVTFFGGDDRLRLEPDLLTRDIWRQIGVPEDRIISGTSKDNFWEAGFTGLCGPCTEIHYDHVAGRNAPELVNRDDSDLVEIGNWVFIEFNRLGDGSIAALPCPGVDNGIGLERLLAVLNCTKSNYNTDLFRPLIGQIEQTCPCPPYGGRTEGDHPVDKSYRVVSDHVRMITYSIADGLMPGNRGNEMKLRRLFSRCFRHAHNSLCVPRGFVGDLSRTVVSILGDTYPVAPETQEKIVEVINAEEKRFLSQTAMIKSAIRKITSNAKSLTETDVNNMTSGRLGPKYSLEYVLDACKSLGIDCDYRLSPTDSPNEESSPSGLLSAPDLRELQNSVEKTEYLPYLYSRADGGNYEFKPLSGSVLAIKRDSDFTTSVSSPDSAVVILDKTVFYASSGGQESDRGDLICQNGTASVTDVQFCGEYVAHVVQMTEGTLNLGDNVKMELDRERRLGLMRSHSASHIVSFVLGKFVRMLEQRGSNISSDHFTFDFSGFTDAIKAEGRHNLLYLSDKSIKAVDSILSCSSPRVSPDGTVSHSAVLCRDYMQRSCSREKCSYVHVDGYIREALRPFYSDSSDLKISASLMFSRSLELVEIICNQIVRTGLGISTLEMSLKDALNLPHLKSPSDTANYPGSVRVVELEGLRAGSGGFEALKHFQTQTAELCCGTHVQNSRDIRAVTVIGFNGVSQGRKRVTVLCGEEAHRALRLGESLRREWLVLRRHVLQTRGSAEWMARLKANNKEITHNVIPRSYRDRLLVDSSQLRFSMTTKLEEIRVHRLLGKYVEVVDSVPVEQLPDPPLLVVADFGSFRDVMASFRRTELLGLTLFVSPGRDADLSLVVLGCPHADGDLLDKAGRGMFPGLDVGKCRGELNMFFYAWLLDPSLEGLKDICRTVLKNDDSIY